VVEAEGAMEGQSWSEGGKAAAEPPDPQRPAGAQRPSRAEKQLTTQPNLAAVSLGRPVQGEGRDTKIWLERCMRITAGVQQWAACVRQGRRRAKRYSRKYVRDQEGRHVGGNPSPRKVRIADGSVAL